MKNEDFIDLFVCPLCKQKLIYQGKGNFLKCPQCKSKFPIIHGIVDAFVSIEGLKTSSVNFSKLYEHFGRFVTRGESDKQRRDITVDLAEGYLLLEIGCAEGFVTGKLAKKIAHVIASDISLSYLRRARMNMPHIDFARLDVHNIPFGDNVFDCLVCTEVLEHTLSPFKALEEIHRVLKSEGFLVISVPNNMTFKRILSHVFKKKDALIGFPGAHISFYDTGSLLQILEVTGFAAKVITTDYVPVPLIGRFTRGLVKSCLPYLGRMTIVKATKKKIDYWEKLDQIMDQCKNKGRHYSK